jgi:colanic acid/amylovoran biosynthesis glycosyltransferase
MYPIAVVSVNQHKYSETFIHNHVRQLPAKVHYLFNGYLPQHYSTDGVTGKAHTFSTGNILHRISGRYGKKHLQHSLVKYLKKNGIKAVLAEYGPSGVEMMPVCQKANVPLIVHFHGYDAYRQDIMQTYGKHYPQLFKQAAAVIVVSKHMRQRLIDLGCPPEKITHTVCGYDTRLFTPCNPDLNPPMFVSVGRFAETKAPHLLLLAFGKVLEQLPEARLTMIGDGHLLESCQMLAQFLQISHAVTFTGSVSPEQVAQYMQQARAFVQHSVTTLSNDTEGTPVAILEAGASGLPVIATRHAGIPDVVLHNETGFLVEEGDIQGMSEYMLILSPTTPNSNSNG